MKTKEELEEAIKDTIQGTGRLFLVQIPQHARHLWMKFESIKSLIKTCMIKG